MRRQLEQLLNDKDIKLWWTDERDNKRHWVGVADVACSREYAAVSVPRRQRTAHHYTEVLHEVAHLELWRWTGQSPSKQRDVVVCRLALDIATQYGFEASVLESLDRELEERIAEALGLSRRPGGLATSSARSD